MVEILGIPLQKSGSLVTDITSHDQQPEVSSHERD
jgi:hypothetical protein